MTKTLIIVLSFLFSFELAAQRHRVYFTDKAENLALLQEPQKILSAKALLRRQQKNVALSANDVPVAGSYLAGLSNMGLTVKFASRWFNYALVEGEIPAELYQLSFVKRVEETRKFRLQLASVQGVANFDYGFADNQIEMLKGDSLHSRGFTGRGMTIAILDAGFRGSDTIPAFDSLRMENRLLGTYNFVNGDTNVYVSGSHGTLVLSTMAANLPMQMVGTAPHASYWLLTSEFEPTETPVEMDNWLAAAEFADSVGADVINSSLGYSIFDDAADNLSYADMDGNTALVTKAADMAASKGIAVVVSAGNEGASSWQFITAPADGDSVLTIGAVDHTGAYASFSSRGPSFDGRIKPDVVAQGLGAVVATSSGSLTNASGTSFSSPIVAGLTACLMQSQPSRKNYEIYAQIRISASQYNNPDNSLGFGIPDFNKAYIISQPEVGEKRELSVFPNPFAESLNLIGLEPGQAYEIEIYDLRAQKVYSQSGTSNASGQLNISPVLGRGIYLLKLKSADKIYTQKIKH